jgi:Xaa-Pro aminopeptidase
MDMTNLMRILSVAMALCENLYVNINENDRAHSEVPYKDLRFANEMKLRFPAHTIKRLSSIMAELRLVKHPLEIEQIQKACNITKDAFKRVLAFTKAWRYRI